jgi:hypothetical protein
MLGKFFGCRQRGTLMLHIFEGKPQGLSPVIIALNYEGHPVRFPHPLSHKWARGADGVAVQLLRYTDTPEPSQRSTTSLSFCRV